MKIDGVSIRPGYVLEYNNNLWAVTKTQHTQPGKGGAYMQVEMKDVKHGTKTNVRFRSDEKVEKVRLDQVDFQFLYVEGNDIHFMHQETFEQITLPVSLLDERVAYLQEGMIVQIEMYDEDAISAQLPEHVVLEVVETEPVVKGQTAASSYKPSILNNGVRVMVPPFIETGTKIIVNTTDSSYVERAK